MATKQINDLTAKATPISTDEIVIQETGGGTTKKATLANAAKGMSHTNLSDIGSLTHAQMDTILGSGTTLTQTVWIPAVAMVSRTTAGAASGTAESTTNKVMINTYDFDTTTEEHVQATVRMPKGWNESTVTAEFVWSVASGTGNVTWAAQGLALGDDDAIDAAFGTAQTVTDAVTSAGDVQVTSATSAITIGGTPAAEDFVVFQFFRDTDNGDDFANDARLHGVTINYEADTLDDA